MSLVVLLQVFTCRLIYDFCGLHSRCVWPVQRANYPGLMRTGWLLTVPMLLTSLDSGHVSRHATSALTMLVNGLARLGTTNDGSTDHGAAMLCRRVAVYSGPFRRHEMAIVEIIIGVLAYVHSFTISYDIWAP